MLDNDLPRPRHGPATRTSETFWSYKKELIGDIAEVTVLRPTSEEGIALLKRRRAAEQSDPAG